MPQFKQKRPLRTDYFSPKPDKAVLKAVPKVVLLKAIPLYLIGLLLLLKDLESPEEDVELCIF